MTDAPDEYTRAEKIAGVLGAVLFLALAVIAADLATGGRVFKRGGCGCPDGDGGADVS
jgi:hypothetical protein